MASKYPELHLHAGLVICTEASIPDLERLIPTFLHFVEGASLIVYCDEAAGAFATKLAKDLGHPGRVDVRPLLTPEAVAEARVDSVVIHTEYWKPELLWWKLEALSRVTREFEGMGILLLDSDIVFTATFSERDFKGVDLVASPYFWKEPNALVASASHAQPVPISERNGHYNGGMFYTNSSAVARTWQSLFEEGAGGFYEEGAIIRLFPLFEVSQFSPRQNFGLWRKQSPSDDVETVHVRHAILTGDEATEALRGKALAAVVTAREALTGAKTVFRKRTRK